MILGRSFFPFLTLCLDIIYTFKLLPQLRTGTSLILQGDYFSLVSLKLDPCLNDKTCINIFGHGFKKRPYLLSMLSLLKKSNLSKTKGGRSLQKTNATCSKCKTNLLLTYLHRSQRHSSSQSQNVIRGSCQIKANFF